MKFNREDRPRRYHGAKIEVFEVPGRGYRFTFRMAHGDTIFREQIYQDYNSALQAARNLIDKLSAGE